jgi:Uma2 family endonuclease
VVLPDRIFSGPDQAGTLAAMAPGAPAPERFTIERYFALVDEGVLHPDDRVELLDGVIVAVAPQHPGHASATGRVDDALRRALGQRAVTRAQMPLVVRRRSTDR